MKDKLESMVPPEIFRTDFVSNLLDATDYVVERNLEVDHELLSDLKLSIRVRKQIAHEKYGGGDEGHSYFIAVLEYCWSYLNPLRKKAKPPAEVKEEERGVPSLQNRFEMLSTEDDGGENPDDDEVENDLPCQPQPRPTESGTKRYTLRELVSGNSRSDCNLFLLTLERLMRSHATLFASLQNDSTGVREDRTDTRLVMPMMQASVAANLAIQQVHSLEQMLTLEHPHLHTVYRVLANVFVVDHMDALTDIVAQKSPIASQFSEKHAVEFLGDAMEGVFKYASDSRKRAKRLVKDFLDRWKFRDDNVVHVARTRTDLSVQQVFVAARNVLRLEVEQEREEEENDLLDVFPDRLQTKSHSWLKAESIGGNRSISHTIRLVQSMDEVVIKMKLGKMFEMHESRCDGVSWGDRERPVSRIQNDMDGLLVDIILPSLFSMCYEGILSFRVPYKKELLSGFVHLCDFVRDPQGPISWALVFTIHTILTSIFVTQESNQYTLLAESACFAFDDYFERLASVEQAVNCTIPRRPPVWDETLEALPSLKRLVTLPIERPREHEMLAIWNPYCAGTFLTYLAFHGNLEAGAMLVDETGQLKMTLHLFNALTQADAIPWGQIALLEGISERFKNCRAIWDVSPSEKGKHQEQWWMSIGMPARTAQELSALEPLSPRLTDMKRDRRLIEVDQLSKSYRRVCLHDFQGASDVSLVAKQEVNDLFHEHFVRAYEATRSMADESVLLRTNLIGLGHYLNEFCIHLFNKMGWMSLVERKVAERK